MTDFDEEQINQDYPGSPGGPIEAAKRALLYAMRSAITGTTLSGQQGPGEVHVSMEYPNKQEQYPGIWVQFSLSSLRNAGMGMVQTDRETGDSLQHYTYTGRVTYVVVAFTNKERDRLAEYLLKALTFSRRVTPNLFTEDGVQETFTDLYDYLDQDEHLSMTPNTDTITPMGQSTTFGVPWDPTAVVYEDAYSFDVRGEFMQVYTNEGYFKLRRVDVVPEMEVGSSVYRPGEWY